MKCRRFSATRHQRDVGPFWWALVLAALILHPYGVLMLNDAQPDPVALAGHLSTVLADLVLLGGALVLMVDSQAVRCRMRASLSAMAAMVAIQDLPVAVSAVADPSRIGLGYRLTDGHLLTVLAAFVLVVVGNRGLAPPRYNPVGLGLVLGISCFACSQALMAIDPTPYLRLGSVIDGVQLSAITVLCALICLQMLRSALPLPVASRLTLGVVAYFCSRLWATLIESTTPPVVSVVAMALASALLAASAVALFLTALQVREDHEHHLQHRAAVAEATVRHGREVAHEIRAATAGIVAGAHLLAADEALPAPRRRALRRMVDVEAARLDRRIAQAAVEEISQIDLDGLIDPLVVSHAAQAHRVSWTCSGQQALGRADAVTEVINVLLTNAARHAGGHGTTIDVRATGGQVEVTVADQGPGLAPEVRDRLFDWGARSHTSPGEGIGLQYALRLAREMGGALRHEEPSHGGAAFVLTLRAPVTILPTPLTPGLDSTPPGLEETVRMTG